MTIHNSSTRSAASVRVANVRKKFETNVFYDFLLYLYNNNYIDVCELDLLYSYFINELKNILDIDLPINKDLLHRNIMDNKVLYLDKIKKRI